ncbi:hypothetical protein J6590_067104 [Homalodisca vitripennis]|nr:hypothetical protein J6590_067104 [Homalodisca vitripennis]
MKRYVSKRQGWNLIQSLERPKVETEAYQRLPPALSVVDYALEKHLTKNDKVLEGGLASYLEPYDTKESHLTKRRRNHGNDYCGYQFNPVGRSSTSSGPLKPFSTCSLGTTPSVPYVNM